MDTHEVLSVCKAFAERCHRRAMQTPAKVRAYEIAVGMELELLRKQAEDEQQAKTDQKPRS